LYLSFHPSSILPYLTALRGIQERNMLTFLKWLFTAFFAAIAWLITGYTVEYFRPYKKK
jgi:hypothetical protein